MCVCEGRGGEGEGRGEGTATYISPVSVCTPLQQKLTLGLAVVGHTLPWEEVVYGCRTSVVSYGTWEVERVESTMHLSTVHLDRLQLQLKLEGVPRNVMSAAHKDGVFYK